MDCNTLVVFGLMAGSAILSAAAAYFYQKAKCEAQKGKTQQLNAALVALQEERASLIIKNQTMYTDIASLHSQVKQLQEQQIIQRRQLDHLDVDKQQLELNNQNLQRLLFAYSPELKDSPILSHF